MGFKNDSTLVFNKYRVIFDTPLDGVGLGSSNDASMKFVNKSEHQTRF